MIVQLNHPGKEKRYQLGRGYIAVGNNIIRLWNSDNTHYRKFINNNGYYLKSIDSVPKYGSLNFWGEWEGYSIFHPNNNNLNCEGIHKPFHTIINRGTQNTDPYVFGKNFKYAICSQTGVMCNLERDNLILFGTSTNNGFLLDTVYVVKCHETAISVNNTQASNYTQIYKEETIEQLSHFYLCENPSPTKKIYQSVNWWDNKKYFSYVPCKLNPKGAFERVIVPIPPMSAQKVGHPYKNFENHEPTEFWNYITRMLIKSGFYLGIKIDEPEQNNNYDSDISNEKL